MSNQLEKQLWALEAYANAAKVLTHAKTPTELIQGVCEGITNQYPYVVAWVGIAQNDPYKTVQVAGISGEARAYAENIDVSWASDNPKGQGPAGEAIRSGKSNVIDDAQTNKKFSPWIERLKTHGIHSSAALPIFIGEKVIGVLMVYASESNVFKAAEIKLFESLAHEIGYGIGALEERASLEKEKKLRELTQKKLMESLELTITAMSSTMEMRDPYTSGHQKKVAQISEAIAKELGWSEDKIHGLRMAALVHDIGKISIPAELLVKPSKLTQIEYALMKEHVNNGYSILKEIPFLWPIADMVRQHHERIDGSGYPLGLKGDQILSEARVLGVADIIDSMSSHRPYRPALGIEKAISEIDSRAGKDLDIEIVEVVKKLFQEGKLSILIK
jgi:putative nucleotidyltransferase with HDIG domain